MNQNNNPAQGVPDYRLQELQEQMRRMDEENRRLRAMFDQTMMRQQQAQPQEPERPLFEEPVDQALNKKFQKLMDPLVNQFRSQLGMLHDENDRLRFNQMYGGETYGKYADKIERLREERARMGQFISREDAYKHIYFEETNKKPQQKPEPPKAPAVPKFDPYTGRMVIEAEPTPEPAPAPAPAAAQPPMQPQGLQQPQMPQMAAPAPQAPVAQELPTLPPAMMNPAVAAQPAQLGRVGIELGSDANTLNAWADKYGDIPL